MTVAEKINVYKEKSWFVKNISHVFEQGVAGSEVAWISYEVYIHQKALSDFDTMAIAEFIVVHFKNGVISPYSTTYNSNSTNLKVISDLMDYNIDKGMAEYYNDIITNENFKLIEL